MNWRRVKRQNFYTCDDLRGVTLLKSYSTVCGVIDCATGHAWRVRWTPTTGRQLSKYLRGREQTYCDPAALRNRIRALTGCDISCDYGSGGHGYTMGATSDNARALAAALGTSDFVTYWQSRARDELPF